MERQWKQMNNDSNNEISWEEYDKTTYYALCKIIGVILSELEISNSPMYQYFTK